MEKASFHIQLQSLRVHVLNILVRNVKRCYSIYFMVNSELIYHTSCFIFSVKKEIPSFWLVIKRFPHAGFDSSERWKRIQAAQVLSKSVFFYLRFICHKDEDFV